MVFVSFCGQKTSLGPICVYVPAWTAYIWYSVITITTHTVHSMER